MKDQVGTRVPTQEQTDQWVAEIRRLREEMAPYGVGLTPEDRKHTLKFRAGGEPIVQKISRAVRAHEMSLPGITPDGMDADLLLIQRMKPVRDAAEGLFQFADDTILEAGSECWYAATAYYTGLARVVSTFPDIKNVVEEIGSFFARRRKRQPSTGGPTS